MLLVSSTSLILPNMSMIAETLFPAGIIVGAPGFHVTTASIVLLAGMSIVVLPIN
jgi:hypothetical protein